MAPPSVAVGTRSGRTSAALLGFERHRAGIARMYFQWTMFHVATRRLICRSPRTCVLDCGRPRSCRSEHFETWKLFAVRRVPDPYAHQQIDRTKRVPDWWSENVAAPSMTDWRLAVLVDKHAVDPFEVAIIVSVKSPAAAALVVDQLVPICELSDVGDVVASAGGLSSPGLGRLAAFDRDRSADAGRLTLGGIEARGRRRDPVEILLQLAQLGDPRPHLRTPPVDQLADVAARRTSTIADGDHVADLGQSQADSLGGADEGQARQRLHVVGAVSGIGAARRRDQSCLLVEAKSRRGDAALA